MSIVRTSRSVCVAVAILLTALATSGVSGEDNCWYFQDYGGWDYPPYWESMSETPPSGDGRYKDLLYNDAYYVATSPLTGDYSGLRCVVDIWLANNWPNTREEVRLELRRTSQWGDPGERVWPLPGEDYWYRHVENVEPAQPYEFYTGALDDLNLNNEGLVLKIKYAGTPWNTHIYWDSPDWPSSIRLEPAPPPDGRGYESEGFEDPLYDGSPEGTVLTGQDEYYLPPESVDHYVYTYAENPLGIAPHPVGGGEQFVAGTGPGDWLYARAQRDIGWGTVGSGVWTVSYDVAVLYPDDEPTAHIGSFCVQPYPGSANYIHLFSVDPGPATNWQAFYVAYDALGVPDLPPGRSPGPEWDNLEANHWYRFTTRVDFLLNRIIEVGIVDLASSASTTFEPADWFLEGGDGGANEPTGFRLFAGAPVVPGMTVAWDNLKIGRCGGDLDGDGQTGQSDLGILLASWQIGDGGDLDGDGETGQSDLGILLADWGCGTDP